MGNKYTIKRKQSGYLVMTLVMVFSLMSAALTAQTELQWTGETNTDATEPSNWNPPNSVFGNILSVDSAHKFTNLPVLTLTGDTDPISQILVNPTGIFTIADAANPSAYLDINNGSNSYLSGTIKLQAGNVSWRKTIYLEDSTASLIIEGGMLRTRSYLSMGRKDLAWGGSVQIKGDGRLVCSGDVIRFSNDTTKSIITITDNGVMEKNGDWVSTANQYIATGQITSDDNFDPYAYYDSDNGTTYIVLRSKDELFMESTETVNVLIGETVPAIKVVNNRGLQSLVTKEWKYATESGGTYQSFNPVQNGDSLYNATFSEAGNYFVVLTGNDGSVDKMSDEVQVAVTSDMISLDPVDEQTIRVGWTGGMITATFKETPTSSEWKYATTSGGPYSGFTTPVTVNEYVPDFADEGIYYVVCEALVSGNTHLSPEVTINMVARSASAQAIEWTGAYSNDFSDNRNFEPMMHPWFNMVNISSRDWVEDPPVLSSAGNDTIRTIWMFDSASVVIQKPDTDTLVLYGNTTTGSTYQTGRYILESGIVKFIGDYVRLDDRNAGVYIKGNSQFLHAEWTGGFIIGNADNGARGGQIVIQDNGYMSVHHFWRWSADSLQSVITIMDNGMLELVGDQTSEMAARIANNQVKTVEGYEIRNELKIVGEDTTTVITARSLAAFGIDPLETQYVGIDLPIDELSTINDDDITSREWKYTTTSGSDYMSFDPAQTGETCTASFNEAGTYYVVCEGSDGSSTYVSDEVVISVVSVEISPGATQELVEFEEGDQLTVTESVAPDSREWKYTTTSGSGYMSFSPARLTDSYRPFFGTAGTYYVVCEAVYGGKGIVSNEVEVTVSVEEGIGERGLPLEIYPNPSDGKFFIDAGNGTAFTVEVFDITGKVVYQQVFSGVSGAQEINLNSEGLHMLKVTSEDRVSISKVIIR